MCKELLVCFKSCLPSFLALSSIGTPGSMANHDMLHHLDNMIVEDERGMPENFWYISNGEPIDSKHNANRIERFLEGHRNIENQEVHTQLCIVIQ
uniref:Predicted protein n=1 Tax=Hordeum vulgare subsp. vulgare TaxID=112509 RepID=F2DKZ6_HORVV|nr:predicted protein [Hordeum vulgare subsp. vulgare]